MSHSNNNLRLHTVHQGFTLIEIMISIGISALIMLATYQFLRSTIASNEIIQERAQRLNEIQRAVRLIGRDFEQLVARSVRDEYGDKIAVMTADDQGDYAIEFTRSGWRNPLQLKRSELQRVAYQYENNQLVRYYWPMLDRAEENSEPLGQILLPKVDELTLQFLDHEQTWHNHWPAPELSGQKKRLLPVAIEVVINVEPLGEIRRLFRLAGQ